MAETVVLRVGMTCEGCVGAVKRVLGKMQGSFVDPLSIIFFFLLHLFQYRIARHAKCICMSGVSRLFFELMMIIIMLVRIIPLQVMIRNIFYLSRYPDMLIFVKSLVLSVNLLVHVLYRPEKTFQMYLSFYSTCLWLGTVVALWVFFFYYDSNNQLPMVLQSSNIFHLLILFV